MLKVNTKEVPLTKVIHLFFTIQESFTDELISFTLSNIINTQALVLSNKDEDQTSLKYPFKMIKISNEKLLNDYNRNEYYLGAEQQVLLMEIAYSFLRLLNKATKHVYHGEMLSMCKSNWGKIEPDFGNLQHEWLFKFNQGLIIRSEILRFYRNFFVFSLNHLMSLNDLNLEGDDKDYDTDKLVTKAHTAESGVSKYIQEEIKSSVAVAMASVTWTEDEAAAHIENYYIKNFFPTIYKYTMGIFKLYHFDLAFKDLAQIQKKFAANLNKCTYKSFIKLNEQFPNVRSILVIKEFLEVLKSKYEEFSKVTKLFKIEGEEFEEEEISRPLYYKLKRYCVIILSSIENLYQDLGFSRLLVKYRRVSHQKPESGNQGSSDGIITSHQVEAKFSINLLNYEMRAGLIDNFVINIDGISPIATKAEIADAFRVKYIESKKNTLLLHKKTVMSFMENSAGHHDCFKTFQDFFKKSIIGISPNLFRSNGQIHGFWKDPFFYILLRIWNNMLTESTEIRKIITNSLIWEDFTTLEKATDMQRVMCILFKLYLDLNQLVTFKTFYDRNWKELWDVYFNVSDIFKNVCEKNNLTSKSFFTGFALIYNKLAQDDAMVQDDEHSVDLHQLAKDMPQNVNASVGEGEHTIRSGVDKQTVYKQTNSIIELKNHLIIALSYIQKNKKKT